MNWLGKMFKKKKKSYNTDCNYNLLIIDDTQEHLHEILGISEERSEDITKIALRAYNDNNTLHTCLVDVIKECKHTNEVVFATLITHRVIEREKSKGSLEDFIKALLDKRG
jgi:hypothetical protein